MKNLKYLLFIILLLPACKEDEMPVEYPFRCKVNGVEWIPQIPSGSQWGGNNATGFQYYDDVKFIELFAQKHTDDESMDQSMTFDAEPVTLGENKIKFRLRNFKDWLKPEGCRFYDLDTLQPHVIYIKSIDREAREIKGTFHFSVYNKECNDSVNITDGEFSFVF